MSAIDPHSITGLVRSSSRPRVPLFAQRRLQPFSALVLSLTSAVVMLALLAAVFFYPAAAQGQDNGEGGAGGAVESLSFGSSVSDQSYTVDAAIGTLTLPEAKASNGDPAITYSLSPALPSGLSFDAAARTISGTPSAAAASQTYTYTAAATGYTPATLTFAVAVVLPAPSAPSSVTVSRADGSLTASWDAVTHATRYHITYSSDGKASWSLAALNHPSASITVSGVDNTKTYVVGVRARNDSGDSGWVNSSPAGPFVPPTPTPTPAPALSFGNSSIDDQSYTQDTAISTLNLPAATGGSGSITYSLSPALPTGLSFDASARTVTGTPTAATGETTYNYTATDGTDTAALSFKIAVAAQSNTNTDLTFGTATIDDQYYKVDEAIDTLNLPAATGGDGSTLTYALSPALPTGLSFDATARTISGTPTGTESPATYNYTATDGTDTARLSFTITLAMEADLSFGDATISAQIYNKDAAIKTVTLPAATGGSGTITYSLSPALPAGLSFDASARTISGTPTATAAYATYTYTATAGADTATLSFTIEVLAAEEGASGQANQAPTVIASTHNTHHQISPSSDPPGSDNQCYHNHGVSYPSGENSYFSDPDGDTLTIKSTSSHPGLAAITQDTPVRLRANHPADTWIDIITTATDPGGLSAQFKWKYKMTCTTAMSVNENSAAGTDVASVGRKGNSNAAASQYTIEGDAAGSFTINSSSGLIEVKSGATLDYETKTSYSGTVKYKATKTVDGTSHTNDSARSITININNLGGPSANTPTVTRDATTPTTVLDVSWTASTSNHPNGVTDYDVQYRLENASSWTSHSHTGTATTAEITGLTAGKSYEVQIRATDAEGTGAWSDSGEAITQYTTQTRSIAENSAANTNVGAAVDADSNPDSYTLAYALSGTDAGSFNFSTSTGQISVKSGNIPDYETKKSYSVTVTMTASGTVSSPGTGNTGLSPNGTGDYIIPVTINITDVNETPQFPKDTDTRTIAENSAANTNIGAAVTSSGGQAALTYSLTGTDASKLSIVSTSGQIQVKAGNIPNFEKADGTDHANAPTYSVTVNVTDGKDSSNNDDSSIDDTIAVTITITDVNEPPPKMAKPTVAKNSTTPKTKLDASWTALSSTDMAGKPPVNDYDVQYRKHGDSSWTDASFTGTTLKTTLSSLTSHKSYEVQVRAVNNEGDGAWSDSGKAITAGDGVTRSIAENSPVGTAIGAAVTATSNPNNYELTHSLGGTDAISFDIDSGTGQIKVKSGHIPDYETKTSYSVEVTVAAAVASIQSVTIAPNNPGNYVVPVTINVTDVNEPTTFADDTAARDIAENSTATDTVGAVVTANADPDGDTLYYSLTGTDAGTFAIDESSGQITVATGKTIRSYEQADGSDPTNAPTYSVTVNVTDKKKADGTADTAIDDTIAVTITVTDVAEKPDAPPLTVSNHSTEPETKISLSWTAPTMTGKPPLSGYDVQYKLADDSTWTTQTHSGTGTTSTLTGLTAGKTYDAQVRAKNDEGDSLWSTGSIITDPNAVTRDIAENSPAGTNVGAAVTANANSAYTYTHTMSGTDAGKFSIASGTGQITVGTGTTLDYETKKKYNVTVTVKVSLAGAGGSSLDPNAPGDYVVPVTINVTDVNEPTTFADDTAARDIAENSTATDTVGAVVTANADPDGDTLYYSLTGTDAGTFAIDESSGQITVATGETIKSYEKADGTDHTNAPTYSVTVNVTDKKASDGTADTVIDDTIAVTVTVTDVVEKPAAPPLTVENHATEPETKIELSWTAPDMTGKPAISGYDVEYKLADDSDWTTQTHSGTGVTSTLTGLTAGKTYDARVRAKNDEGDSPWSTDDIITDGNAVTRSIAENSPAGTNIGAAVTAKDNASYDYTHALSGTDAGDFDIVSTSGQIQVKSPLNYETKNKYSVIVTVTVAEAGGASIQSLDPNAPGDYIVPVTINVTDVNEAPDFTDDTAARNIAENSAADTNVGAVVTASDVDGDTLKYSLSGTDAGKFTIVEASGQIQVKSGTVLNYEKADGTDPTSAPTYSVTVTATDPDDETDTIAVTITVTDVDEPPSKMKAPKVTNHDTTPKTKLDAAWTALTSTEMSGKPLVTDYDLRYRKHGGSWKDATFKVATTSTTLSSLDPHTSYEVQVRPENHEGEGPWSDSGTAITDGDGVIRSINENSPAGTNVGAPVTATENPNKFALTHTMTGTDAGKFTIVPGTGQIKVKSGTVLDFESGTTKYNVTVTVTAEEGAGASAQSFTLVPNNPGDYVVPVVINVVDVNEKPEFNEGDSAERSVPENSGNGTKVGAVVVASDEDRNPRDTLTYSLSGTDASDFKIDSSTGQITVGDNTTIKSYENKDGSDPATAPTYSVTVEVHDGLDADHKTDTSTDDTIAITIKVTDVNEPPGVPGAPTQQSNTTTRR